MKYIGFSFFVCRMELLLNCLDRIFNRFECFGCVVKIFECFRFFKNRGFLKIGYLFVRVGVGVVFGVIGSLGFIYVFCFFYGFYGCDFFCVLIFIFFYF